VVVVFLNVVCLENLWKKKIVAGSLMEALIRPGGGDSGPSDSDQVCFCSVR